MPARTNACAICRKKRIKCDATLPQCLMCIKFGRNCPGSSNGPIIVDMTNSTIIGQKKKKNAEKDVVQVTWEALPEEVVSSISTMTMQISQRHALNEVFYGNFLAYFTTTGEAADIQNRQTWLHRLPDFAADGSNGALELAVRATASAFSFAKTRHTPLMQDALKLYGRSLNQHFHILRTKKKVTMHTVSTSVLLSIFEAMNATTASAYRQHISGAAELVKLAGPEECWMGVLCQLFFHIRVQMAFVYLTTRQEDKNSLCSEEILRETLTYYRMPVFQRLIHHMTRLTALYLQLEDNEDGRTPHLMDLEEYIRIKSDIDALWLEYELSAEEQGQSLFWITPSGATEYRDAYTALCVAYFASARALFSILAPRLAASYLDFTDHYQQMLDIAQYLGGFKIGCAFMRMATPLYLVAMHAHRKEQREIAIGIFEEWRVIGLGGISALALESIYRRQEQNKADITIRLR
ncbi:hypothetical protein P171DRAFT_427668 [Karstenula rhodostoma CBS 690.94]|uniref:Zn(2)-C6 fungal-type domain-containing protein n=1 Tax=Karstenula rhodostoma CBS 690.94 TaxID=1392251 RepID=A0A9P4PQJ7_9PLEO|nr:hypothetical protein P171DRAFT_427668 [Karstenula rhodostoma CBS 690.94]